MPIRNGSFNTGNNRILPTNTRAVDVARKSIDLISHIQNKRYDNAFQIQGFEAVLYSKKKSGLKCLCQSKNNALSQNASILDDDGNAKPGVINALLTGQEFGVRPYGAVPRRVFDPIQVNLDTDMPPPKPSFLKQNALMPTMFDMDEPNIAKPMHGTPGQGFARSGEETSNTGVVTEDGFADNGPVSGEGTEGLDLINRALGSGFDTGFGVSSDVACSICFGTGYVGGFNIYNGFRLVLDAQQLQNVCEVNYENYIPSITGQSIEFLPQVLPQGALYVDSLKAFNNARVVTVGSITVDGGATLTSEQGLIAYCDGRPHQITVNLPGQLDADGDLVDCTITHLEIQYNQSYRETKFEFPKAVQNAVETLIERTDPMQLIMSPMIPNVGNGDVITDCTYGKTFQVTTANWWNDKRRAVLGWECDVRPCQPQELFTLLPKRRANMQSQNTPSAVRANGNAAF